MKQKQQNLNASETGRSMVEMLGVLAVIGVLSVAGVSGYRIAMDKHYANEILNEVSKRAVVAAGQLLKRDDIDLGEFATTVHDYTIAKATSTMQNEFAIQVSGVPDAITQKVLQTGMPTATDISTTKSGDKNTITFAFNNDLTPGNAVARQLTCTGAKPTVDLNPVDTNTCVNGQWQCPNGQLECNGTCCGEKQLCISPGTNKGTCYTPSANDPESETSCATNQDCLEKGYDQDTFCLLSGTSSTTTDTSGCKVATQGVCTPISEYYGGVGERGAFKGWTYSKDTMDWWAANNWCLAQGKFLVTLDDVYKATGTSKTSDATEKGIRQTALAAMFGDTAYSIWTGTTYSSTSCNAYRVNSVGLVSDYYRGNDYRAVCRG